MNNEPSDCSGAGDEPDVSGSVGLAGEPEESDVVAPYRREAAQMLWGYCSAVRCTRRMMIGKRYCARHEEMFAKRRKVVTP